MIPSPCTPSAADDGNPAGGRHPVMLPDVVELTRQAQRVRRLRVKLVGDEETGQEDHVPLRIAVSTVAVTAPDQPQVAVLDDSVMHDAAAFDLAGPERYAVVDV